MCMGTGNPGRRGRQGTCVEILSTLRRHSANLLPAAKFVSNGFLINQPGQVDLTTASLNLVHLNTRPLPPPAPWISLGLAVGKV